MMSDTLYRDLEWLPRPPGDFSQQCRELSDSELPGEGARLLASAGLNVNQLTRLGRAITKLQAQERDLSPLRPFKLGLLGNGTLDFLLPALTASAARQGILLSVIKADYDQVLRGAMSPDSEINRARNDAVLLALDTRGLPMRVNAGDLESAEGAVDRALSYVASIREGIHRHSGATCIVQTVAPEPEALFGSLDRAVPGTARYLSDRFNRMLIDSLQGSQDILLDVAALASTVGFSNWHSP